MISIARIKHKGYTRQKITELCQILDRGITIRAASLITDVDPSVLKSIKTKMTHSRFERIEKIMDYYHNLMFCRDKTERFDLEFKLNSLSSEEERRNNQYFELLDLFYNGLRQYGEKKEGFGKSRKSYSPLYLRRKLDVTTISHELDSLVKLKLLDRNSDFAKNKYKISDLGIEFYSYVLGVIDYFSN
jgi:hypothetical protein